MARGRSKQANKPTTITTWLPLATNPLPSMSVKSQMSLVQRLVRASKMTQCIKALSYKLSDLSSVKVEREHPQSKLPSGVHMHAVTDNNRDLCTNSGPVHRAPTPKPLTSSTS